MELGHEEFALEAGRDVNAFLPLAAAGVGALHFMHGDLGGVEGHPGDHVHHGPGAAGQKQPLSPLASAVTPSGPQPIYCARGPSRRQTATPASPSNGDANSSGAWLRLHALCWPIFHAEK